MNIPKVVADRVAAIEHEIDLVESEAMQQVQALRRQLETLDFAISAFAESETPPPARAKPALNDPLRERVYRVIAAQGPLSAQAIGAEIGRDYHSIGSILGLLSRTDRIKRVGDRWAAAP